MGYGDRDRERGCSNWKGFTGVRRNGPGRGVKTANFVDYKDYPTIKRFTNANGKLFSRKRGQTSPKCQRLVQQAIKRARYMGILSYTN